MDNDLFEQTTIRNRNLINYDEQLKLRKTVGAFFGLSVGSHAALTWELQSRADKIIIADPDTIEYSNLNRIREDINNVGCLKVSLIKDKLEKINPNIKTISLVKTNIKDLESFFKKSQKLDFIVEEIDDIKAKLFLRKIAKSKKIPLINATDVGNNVFVDIERYDLEPQPLPFLGRVKDVEKIDFDKITPKDKIKLAFKIVDLEHNSLRMLQSLLEIGKTIETWPQLGATATMSGGIVTTAITKIVLGENIKSGRYIISLDKIFQTENSKLKLIKAKKLVKHRFDI